MANCYQGILKVKGKHKNVLKLLNDKLQVWESDYFDQDKITTWNRSADDLIFVKYISCIERTDENYINYLIERINRISIDPSNIKLEQDGNGKSCIAINYKAINYIDSEFYALISKQYNVDIKIDAFEEGLEFSRHIHVKNGKVKKDKEKYYEKLRMNA